MMSRKTRQKPHCSRCGASRKERTFPSTGAVCNHCLNEQRKRRRRENVHARMSELAAGRRSRAKNWPVTLASNCRKHDPASTLTASEIQSLYDKQKGRCFWFNVPLLPTARSRFPSKPSVDRLDASKPHTLENCVLACFAANIGRNSTKLSDWKNFLRQLRKVI